MICDSSFADPFGYYSKYYYVPLATFIDHPTILL